MRPLSERLRYITLRGNLINQEVDRRIAERMPSEEDIQNHIETTKREDGSAAMDEQTFYEGAKWYRSSLRCSGKPNNTEEDE